MADTTPPATLADNLDAVLRKYGKIWIWSILCTATAALSVRSLSASLVSVMLNSGFGNRRVLASQPPSVFLLVLLAAISPAATIASVYYLLKFLKGHLLPILFPQAQPGEAAVTYTVTGSRVEESPEQPAPAATGLSGADLLYRSFAAVLIGIVVELILPLVAMTIRQIF
jgi:hypothetical protein